MRTALFGVVLGLMLNAAHAADDASPGGRAKQLVDALQKKDYAAAATHFSDKLKKLLPGDALAKVWGQVIGAVGELKKSGAARPEKVDGEQLVFVPCEFAKGKFDLRVTFDKEGRITGFNLQPPKSTAISKPPPYVRADAFTEVEVTIGADSDWPLPGTLSVPKGKGPFAVVVLVHGSGPHDRDETIGPSKPFRDLAQGLASQGVAVLRYVKRTQRHGAKMMEKTPALTVKEEVTDDVTAAVALLRSRKEIDPARVFVLGHSLGGYVAPRIAAADPRLAGIIVMGGNSRPLEDLLEEQYPYLWGLEGKTPDEVKKLLEGLKAKTARVRAKDLPADAPAKDLPLGLPASYWRDLRGYDPAATAAKLKQPVLVLQGGRDYQVTMTDFEGWKKALTAHKDATLKSYPTLHHLFIEGKGKGKATPAEYAVPGHVAKEVVDDVAAWVKKR